jgi:hypothetical protein
MRKNAINRREFLKGTVKTAVASVFGGVLKFLPEVQGVFAGESTQEEVELIALEATDARVEALKSSLHLTSAKFASDINWNKAFLGTRRTQGEALVVLLKTKRGSGQTRFLVARLVESEPQVPIKVSIFLESSITSKQFSGTIAVFDLDDRVLKRLRVKDGQAITTKSGKAPGLARPASACRQPDTDNCVAFYYGACIPLITGLWQ